MSTDKVIALIVVLIMCGVLGYVIYDLVTTKRCNDEGFESNNMPVAADGPVHVIEEPKAVGGYPQQPNAEQMAMIDANMNGAQQQNGTHCAQREILTAGDLLPGDAKSLWAQVNPSGQGSLGDQNFLNAGHHIGINTIGQSMRNANLQLRSEPPNPQMPVCPWNQSTIGPDTSHKAFEIGCVAVDG